MTFYVKLSRDAEVEGPFTIEQVNQMLRQKRFTFKSLAIADAGQGLQAVQRTPLKQWIKLPDIPGYEPDPDDERKSALLIVIICALLVLIPVAALAWLAIMLNRIH
jgi:hypothetical protein